MTERLYYADPCCREFEARIARVERRGERMVVTLDRTSFYPTSGGQPFDTGTIAGARVVDVIEEGGIVLHVLDRDPAALPRLEAGHRVHGAIDWRRRFDHMQQHSGQHVLSAAFDRLFGSRTISFHLGSTSSTVDLDRELPPTDVAAAEAEANRIVWEDRPVSIRFVDAQEASALPLRKEAAREGTLRLIEIDGFDLSACGGTHVARTGSIGVIAVGAVERFKGGQRVEFFCGGRALDRFRSMQDALGGAVRLLSVLPGEVPAAVERLQAETRSRQRRLAGLEQQLAGYRAAALTANAETTPAGRLVLAAVDADANGLKSLAVAIADTPGCAVVLVSTSRPALVVAARSKDLTLAANQLIADLTASFGGRGGGKPDLAQAGGLDAPAESVLARVRVFLAR